MFEYVCSVFKVAFFGEVENDFFDLTNLLFVLEFEFVYLIHFNELSLLLEMSYSPLSFFVLKLLNKYCNVRLIG